MPGYNDEVPELEPAVDAVIVDRHVGARLKERRTALSLSQGYVAERTGVTFQQIQKYENGANRVSASRLFHLSQILQVPISFFFAGLAGSEEADAANTNAAASHVVESDQASVEPKQPSQTRRPTVATSGGGENGGYFYRANRVDSGSAFGSETGEASADIGALFSRVSNQAMRRSILQLVQTAADAADPEQADAAHQRPRTDHDMRRGLSSSSPSYR